MMAGVTDEGMLREIGTDGHAAVLAFLPVNLDN
jgi:hypothetical protein